MKYTNSNKPAYLFSLIVCFSVLLGQTACSSSQHTLLTGEPRNQSMQLLNQPTDEETEIGNQHENQVLHSQHSNSKVPITSH